MMIKMYFASTMLASILCLGVWIGVLGSSNAAADHIQLNSAEWTGSAAALLIAQAPHAEKEAGEHHEGGHATEMDMPGKPGEIAAEILTRDLMIQDNIKTGKLQEIHKPAFEAKDLAEELQEHAKGLKPEDEKILQDAVQRIGQAAKLLDQYGDANDAAKTKVTYKSFEKAIQDIKKLYPAVVPSHYWTCSMHPEVQQATGAGSCPSCNMKLIEKKSAAQGEHHEMEKAHEKSEPAEHGTH